MLLQSGLRMIVLVIAGTVLPVNVGRDVSERPRVSLLDPQVAAPGDIVTAHGANLERSRVAELILTNSDGKAMAHIVEQRTDLIRFRVPMMLNAGDYQIVLLADTQWGTAMIEQDVVLTVLGAYRSALYPIQTRYPTQTTIQSRRRPGTS